MARNVNSFYLSDKNLIGFSVFSQISCDSRFFSSKANEKPKPSLRNMFEHVNKSIVTVTSV